VRGLWPLFRLRAIAPSSARLLDEHLNRVNRLRKTGRIGVMGGAQYGHSGVYISKLVRLDTSEASLVVLCAK